MRVVAWLCLLGLLAGCLPPPTPTPLPTSPPTLTATFTPAPTPTATPTALPTLAAAPATAAPRVQLAAVFAPWYGYDYATGGCVGEKGSHWGPDWGVVDRPKQGFYCSADPAVVDRQLAEIERAGIQVLLVSWWGWGDGELDGKLDEPPAKHDAYFNRGIAALLERIRARKSSPKVALIAEPFTLTQGGFLPDTAGGTRILDRLWADYYQPYADLIYRWEGKPLVVAFDPMRLPDDPRFAVKRWSGGKMSEESLGAGWEWFFAPEQPIHERISNDGVAFVFPRFDEAALAASPTGKYITWPPRQINPARDPEYYREQWQELSLSAFAVRLVVVYGWNLYGERAQIEPDDGPGDFVDLTARYFRELAQP